MGLRFYGWRRSGSSAYERLRRPTECVFVRGSLSLSPISHRVLSVFWATSRRSVMATMESRHWYSRAMPNQRVWDRSATFLHFRAYLPIGRRCKNGRDCRATRPPGASLHDTCVMNRYKIGFVAGTMDDRADVQVRAIKVVSTFRVPSVLRVRRPHDKRFALAMETDHGD